MFSDEVETAIDEAWANVSHPACNTCRHFKLGSNPPSCKAFKVIPSDILGCLDDHRKPVEGDHGIQWEATN